MDSDSHSGREDLQVDPKVHATVYKVKLPGNFLADRVTISIDIIKISASRVLITCPTEFPVGTKLHFRLSAGNISFPVTVKILLSIYRPNKFQYYGCQFKRISNVNKEIIHKSMLHYEETRIRKQARMRFAF